MLLTHRRAQDAVSFLPPLSRHLSPGPCFLPFSQEEVEQTIHARFEEQVGRHPGRLAIKSRQHELTYEELNRVANGVARALVALRGVGREAVALLLDKDVLLIASILGVLKAGKCYVPLSASYPAARNAFIVADCGARLILTDTKSAATARRLAGAACQVVDLEALSTGPDDSDLGLDVSAEDHAYILYTSGSTGQPKGVVEKHRNVLHNIKNYTNDVFIDPTDRLTLLGSCSYSGSLKDLYGALLNGASLFPFEVDRQGLTRLGAWLRRQQITIYDSAPVVFRNFVAALGEGERFPDMRVVRLGGEPLTCKDVDLFRRHFPRSCVFVNGYGASETGTACLCVIDDRTELSGNAVPVGHPVAGVEVLLLDEEGRDVGTGRPGEIAIASTYLSPGYWGRPDLTAAAFRDDPAGGGRRLYLTGDRGVRLPNGALVHAGRKDFQVKVRGHRVELAEVEAALLESPRVKEAVVLASTDLPEDRCLVAYAVPSARDWPATLGGELLDSLRDRLPSYAVPSAVVLLETFPLNGNGKVDRKALAATGPLPSPRPRQGVFVAPRTGAETQMARLWEQLLGTGPVGRQDNFFELGGSSLLAARLAVLLRKNFHVDLPLSLIAQAGTLERVAGLIEPGAGPPTSSLVALQPHGSRPPFFCVHGLGGEVLCLSGLARYLGEDQPLYGLQGQAAHLLEPAPRQIAAMATAYVEEILTVVPEGPFYLGGYSFGGAVAYEMAQQFQRRGLPVAFLGIIDQRRPDLAPRLSWDADHVWAFLRNIPAWIRDELCQGSPRELLARARRKLQMCVRQGKHLLGLSGRTQPDVRDILDVSQVPPEFQCALQSRYAALRGYTPQPYPGQATLFRARTQPLFRWQNWALGWDRLVRGGLKVIEVPGTHDGLDGVMAEPHVQTLASELRQALDQAQRQAGRHARCLPRRPASGGGRC